jgi:hypothetical protein
MSSADVREHLIDALELDLVGPRTLKSAHATEQLDERPTSWYLTGFLVPFEADAADRAGDDIGDELDVQGRRKGGDDEQKPDEPSVRQAFFPSSIGLSVLVPGKTATIEVEVNWGDYTQTEHEGGRRRWQRTPRRAQLPIPLAAGKYALEPGGDGQPLELVVAQRSVPDGAKLPSGTRALSLFVVNQRKPSPKGVPRDLACAFQVELRVTCSAGFVARPDRRGAGSGDTDDEVAELQYRDAFEYAVGHNVSAHAEDVDGSCRVVVTRWMPRAEVEKVIAAEVAGVEFRMEELAEMQDATQLHTALDPMIEAYGVWLGEQQREFGDADRNRTAGDLLTRAEVIRQRIAAGIAVLDEPGARFAFCMANRVVATAMRQRGSHDGGPRPEKAKAPEWRPFQLAFILLNLVGIAHPDKRDREFVDLLFFPTGGGKTEAYLGLAAFTLVLRRLRNPGLSSAGVSVLMRYTLRLLTLDQLGRAATLICALELERQRKENAERLGPWPFEIGLWVGQTATPNVMGRKGDHNKQSARTRTIAFQNQPDRKPSPIPLENCPWCGVKFEANAFRLGPNSETPTRLDIRCTNRDCVFTRDRPLPIVAVDEPLYRRLPCFLIATVDKFAGLPWVGTSGVLLGGADRHDRDGFYGPAEPGVGRRLEQPLLPPDLIIQDELHLISGPLGTMMGLYETAIDALATRTIAGKRVRPKIVASTATVRRAERQIEALFARSVVDVFPPPGPDRRDSFFAKTVSRVERNPRVYVGIAAQGRSLKVVMLRSYLALMGAAERLWEQGGGAKAGRTGNDADPYMTLLGYFNSLRELGGSRRIVEDEVRARLTSYGLRRRVGEAQGSFANRKIDDVAYELTSRVPTNEVAETKRKLALRFHEKQRVDVALATNMISVGLDITRLGLMVVLGQPKGAAEYIQATSRVGRDDERPGLVVTLLNVHKPRDRSHYECFEAWHTSFYRSVEATSVTPFSPRALDRGLPGVVVALGRHGHPKMTPARAAIKAADEREQLRFVRERLVERAETHDSKLGPARVEALRRVVHEQSERLLEDWAKLATTQGKTESGLRYQEHEGTSDPPLLHQPTDTVLALRPQPFPRFHANRSLRDVEPSVNLWIRTPDGNYVEGEEDDA